MGCKTNRSLKVLHMCAGCGKKQVFICSGKFRVNANGGKIDIWLIYRCEKCKHTLNIPVYERTKVSRIPPELYARFMESDEELILAYTADAAFFKSRHLTTL